MLEARLQYVKGLVSQLMGKGLCPPQHLPQEDGQPQDCGESTGRGHTNTAEVGLDFSNTVLYRRMKVVKDRLKKKVNKPPKPSRQGNLLCVASWVFFLCQV